MACRKEDRSAISSHFARFLFMSLVVTAVARSPQRAWATEAFVDVSTERGLVFKNVNGASGKKYLVETVLGGAAWLDYDGDGYLDLYLVQGHDHLERPEAGASGVGNVLYRNVRGAALRECLSGIRDRGSWVRYGSRGGGLRRRWRSRSVRDELRPERTPPE